MSEFLKNRMRRFGPGAAGLPVEGLSGKAPGLFVPVGPPEKVITIEVDASGTGTLKANVFIPDGKGGRIQTAMHPYEVCLILITMCKTTMPALLQTPAGVTNEKDGKTADPATENEAG